VTRGGRGGREAAAAAAGPARSRALRGTRSERAGSGAGAHESLRTIGRRAHGVRRIGDGSAGLTQVVTVERQTEAPRRSGRRPHGRAAAPRLHLGRLAILFLVLIGASFYVAPLQAFFVQQDRYQHAADALQAARADNAAYALQMKLLTTKTYVAQVARADSMLVPPGTQVFVVKGLPGDDAEPVVRSSSTPTAGSISVLDRVEDLWRTLLR